MNNGWQKKSLGEVAELKGRIGWRGLTAKEYKENGPLFLSVHSLNHGDYVSFKDAFHISEERYIESPEIMLQKDDVLICKDGAGIGKVGIVGDLPNRTTINSSLLLIRSGNSVLPKYLYRCLTSPYFQKIVNSRLQGATTPHLYQRDITEFPIAVPPIDEQKRIVAILDEAFAAIDKAKQNAEKNLQNARELFESHLQSIFTQRGDGWLEKSLEELGTITSSKRIFKSEYVNSGVPFYRTKEIKQLANGREITTELFISEARYKEIKSVYGVPKPGELLVTAIGTIGEIYVVEGNEDFYFKDGNVLWLKEFSMIDPNFLKYVLISFVESLNKMAHGSAYSALPIQRLNAHKIFVPPVEEQKQIVDRLDGLSVQVGRLESVYRRKVAALDELKKSLLQRAFSGKI